ncbi:hypothetical protein [Sphingobium yanoikuyae]|uniref:hypothetical protein n=1 Tax=Sphingobium yanoikuyae TaxID=13690 RepID=UPI0028ABB1F0|nr:hypothetical protein [Sphingobium yanoikuyae]
MTNIRKIISNIFLLSIFISSIFVITACGNSRTSDNFADRNWLNDSEIRKLVVGHKLTNPPNGPYNKGLYFYENRIVRIVNSSGENRSIYKIENSTLCFQDFKKICSKFFVEDGKIMMQYTQPSEIGYYGVKISNLNK